MKPLCHKLSTVIDQLRAMGTPREWINTALAGIVVAALMVALYILI